MFFLFTSSCEGVTIAVAIGTLSSKLIGIISPVFFPTSSKVSLSCITTKELVLIASTRELMIITNSLVLLGFQKLLDAWVHDFRDTGSLFGKSKGSAVDGVTIKSCMDIGEVFLETRPHFAVMFVLFVWILRAVIILSLVRIEPNSIGSSVQKHGQCNIVSNSKCLLLRFTLV